MMRVRFLRVEREQAVAPLEAILKAILADEVKHARLGWKLVRELAPRHDAAARDRLGAYLVAVFEHQIEFHAPFLRMPAGSARSVSIGAPDGPSSWRIFVDTMTTVTVPGLERHGLPAREAWHAAIAA